MITGFRCSYSDYDRIIEHQKSGEIIMKEILLIIGIIAVVISAIFAVIIIKSTPDNFRGSYPKEYIFITLGGLIAGGIIITLYFLV